jgi:hypothetical protein
MGGKAVSPGAAPDAGSLSDNNVDQRPLRFNRKHDLENRD